MKLRIRQDIQAALRDRHSVVALESTLITHGLPHPENARVGYWLEAEAAAAGAVPATIALWKGQAVVGLGDGELDELASLPSPRKCSLRDLPIAMARGETGGTTVAATMYLARAAGISVFATGGIGGVHRGHPFDVSADLTALGSIPMTVVCAGAKAILDLPLTLEVLETQGVTIVGYRTSEFPAFYGRRSGLPVDVSCDTPDEIAAIIRQRDEAGLRQAILVVNPVPEADALPDDEAEAAIRQALAEAEAAGVSGKAVTPFLLARVSALTETRSMKANLSLLQNNVRLAAAIAHAGSLNRHEILNRRKNSIRRKGISLKKAINHKEHKERE
jgi:pseudouridine-5'-phosphate glycosidase